MEIIKDVLLELFSMFVTDMRLTLTTLALVLLAAILIMALQVNTLVVGCVLLFGCFGIVVEATIRETRTRRNR